jgi:hypothetical protein
VAQPWYRDVAKTSLIACIASAVSLVAPLRDLVRIAFEVRSVATPLVALSALLTLSLPLFYLCLFHELEDRELLLSKRLQLLSSAGALALLAVTAASLPGWVRSFAPASVLTPPESHLAALLNGMANLAAILPLLALSAQPACESGLPTMVSRLLRVTAAVAAIAFGLFTAGAAVGVIASPWTASQLQRLAVPHAARSLLGQFGLFVAPYVVWRSTSRQCDVPVIS